MALGIDIAGTTDVDPHLSLADDRRSAAEAVMRGLLHDPGVLWWAPESGYSLPGKLHGSASLASVIAGVEQQCLRDERVQSVEVSGTRNGDTTTISIALVLTDDFETDLTLTVDAAGTVLSATT